MKATLEARGTALSREAAPALRTRKRTRIQAVNEERILDAALDAFSAHGFRGATLDEIAVRAGMTKPNLLYYFRRKQDIYLAVLGRTLEGWLEPLRALDPNGDPLDEIRAYIARKLDLSRASPRASQLFANEILAGAPMLRPVLEGPLKDLVDEKAAVIRGWIDAGRMAAIDPHHLIFMIWATTQHFADFDVQIRAITGGNIDDEAGLARARATLETLFLRGLAPR